MRLLASLGFWAAAAATQIVPIGENIMLEALGEGWKIGFQQKGSRASIIEFVRGKETVHAWTELVTLTVVDGAKDADLDKYTENLKAGLAQRCKAGPAVKVVGREMVSGLPARTLTVECRAYAKGKPESQVQLAVGGREALYVFQRARKVGRLDADTVKKWSRFLKKLQICDTRDPSRPCAGAGQVIDARTE